MRKKLLLIFTFIIILIFVFSINAYASTDYSVQDGSIYRVVIDFEEQTEFDLPYFNSTTGFQTSELYFVITYNSSANGYLLAVSSEPFYGVDRTDSYMRLRTASSMSSNSPIHTYTLSGNYKEDGSTWSYSGNPGMVFFGFSNYSFLMSSDDIYYENSEELLVEKYVKPSVDEETEEDSNNDNYVLSGAFNNEWIDSYLDLNMNPTDGIKKFIDDYQDYFNFSSSDLGSYWVCEKLNDTKNGGYFYYFIFAPGPIYIRYHYNGSATEYEPYAYCEYYTSLEGNTEGNIYTIHFTKNGFYGSKELEHISNENDSAEMFQIYHPYHCGVYEHTYIAANHDIKNTTNDKEEGSLAFLEPVTKNGTTLAPVIQREKKRGTLQVVLKEIILILPLIIAVLVCFLGLRKALKTLFQLLHRS